MLFFLLEQGDYFAVEFEKEDDVFEFADGAQKRSGRFAADYRKLVAGRLDGVEELRFFDFDACEGYDAFIAEFVECVAAPCGSFCR